jgi:multicomponent Na+:H+ antiporter subunit D
MIEITIAWLALPFLIGFVIYLLPTLDRWLALGVTLIGVMYSWLIFLERLGSAYPLGSPLDIQLLDNFGVSLTIDQLSGWFILTNALVTTAVITYCWQTNKQAFFYMQLIILHGSVNAVFICADLISLYVALEVISIATFVLIAYPRSDRSIWVGLRYLFISNVAMLFYLVGAVLVYQTHHSFNYAGLQGSPIEAIALIFLGLLVKGGIFVSGLWLPLTHAEAETPVSAMLSGIVIKTGVFPLLRFALLLAEIEPVIRIIGVATALLGVGYAIVEPDTKRTLAFSTVSQVGFILAAPVVGGFYALTHGVTKSVLFLTTGKLPSRNFAELKQQKIEVKVWLVLLIASLSMSGFPLLSGFAAKTLTNQNLLPWQTIIINIAAVGTAVTYAKFIFLSPAKSAVVKEKVTRQTLGYWWATLILLGSLLMANGFYSQTYTLNNLGKSLAIIATGWIVYNFIFQKLTIKLSRVVEEFDHLVGVMSLTLILLFWMLWVQSSVSI